MSALSFFDALVARFDPAFIVGISIGALAFAATYWAALRAVRAEECARERTRVQVIEGGSDKPVEVARCDDEMRRAA